MRRRELLMLLGAAMTAAHALSAQQKAMPVIGFLGNGLPDPWAPLVDAFRQGLSEAGYVEGQNVAVEYRWSERRYDRLPALAAELVARRVDVIVTAGGTPPTLAAKSATSTIPIVFAGVDNPVGTGLVVGLSRPGGNVTGFSIFSLDLVSKRLELLSELIPHAGVIALLADPNNQITERMISDEQEAARAKGLQLGVLKASSKAEIDAGFASLGQRHADALIVSGFFSLCEQIAELAAGYAIPTMYDWRTCVAAGGLVSYGASLAAIHHQAGIYAGKILNGAKPADLPVQQPTKFELVINLKTAKTLGLTIPQTILLRADEVIE
jgi:putative tryptophan/tyrosine transport system substrate-binding protein